MFKNYKIKRIISIVLVCLLVITGVNWPENIKIAKAAGSSWDFNYTGEPQIFTVPTTGWYTLETWGAQGGSSGGGQGGYTSGKSYLTAGTKLYLYVGGQGADGSSVSASVSSASNGSFNGGAAGGIAQYSSSLTWIGPSGGGATDIRLGSNAGIYTLSNGMADNGYMTYGAYQYNLPLGTYQIDYYGSGFLNSNCIPDAYYYDSSLGVDKVYTAFGVTKSDTHISYYIKITETSPTARFEFRMGHSTGYSFSKMTFSNLGNRIMVAGGGGATTNAGILGGAGGADTAENGWSGGSSGSTAQQVDANMIMSQTQSAVSSTPYYSQGGTGASQSTGGLGGTGTSNNYASGYAGNGILGLGGVGGNGIGYSIYNYAGAGAGGGYYGGGGSAGGGFWIGQRSSAGGGSSYVNTSYISNSSMTRGGRTGNGFIRITSDNTAPTAPKNISIPTTIYRNNEYVLSWSGATDNENNTIYYKVTTIINGVETTIDTDLTDTTCNFYPTYTSNKTITFRVYTRDSSTSYGSYYIDSPLITFLYNTAPNISIFSASSINHKTTHKVPIYVAANDNEKDTLTAYYQVRNASGAYNGSWIYLGTLANGSVSGYIDYSANKTKETQYITIKINDSVTFSTIEKTFTLTNNIPVLSISGINASYNNTFGTNGYTSTIPMTLNLSDADLDDTVTLSYGLDTTTYSNTVNISSGLVGGTSHTYNVNIDNLSSGTHTLYVKAMDTYGNIVTKETTFTIFKAPVINSAIVSNIDHSLTHKVPVTIDFVDDNSNSTTRVEYTFNDVDWFTLFSGKTTGTYVGEIDFTNDYLTTSKSVKFRANNGLDSAITANKTFNVINNAPVINITSVYDEDGYNNLVGTEGYTNLINLNVDVKDIDLNDIVTLSYKIDSTSYSSEFDITNDLKTGTSHTYNVNIVGLTSGTHTLYVKAEDLYGNVVEKSINFKVYKAPVINNVVVSDINHGNTHDVPVVVNFSNDNVSSDITIEYKINDGSWITWFDGSATNSYSGTINYLLDYNKTSQIKFRINNGHQYSAETDYYPLNLANNTPVINITSTYDAIGYNNVSGTTNYTSSIDLDIDLSDADLNDVVTLSYGLDTTTYSNEIDVTDNLKTGTSHTYNVNISGLTSGTHTLYVKAEDLYGNIVEKNISFKVYKAPVINNVVVSDFNHDTTHNLPIKIDFTDDNLGTNTKIEYSLNNGSWITLMENKTTGLYDTSIDFSGSNLKGAQVIKFRAHNGIQYGNETINYSFDILTNVPEVSITSIYNSEGYDTFNGNDTYTSEITLNGIVNDLDLDDSVVVDYYLDNTFINSTTLSALDSNALNKNYSFTVDIRGCASGSHALKVIVTDKYGNTENISKNFITYKSPDFISAIVTSIDHKDTHDLPITVTVNDTDNKDITVQYKLNDGDWTDLLVDKLSGTYNTTINLKDNIISSVQAIKFRAISTINGLGTKYSDDSNDYTFTLKSNTPEVNITSTYDALGYDTFSGNATYKSTINLSGTVNDLDLDDSVVVDYYLDDIKKGSTTLNTLNNKPLNDNYNFTVDISNCISGPHILKVIATDKYGKTSEISESFITYKSPELVSATVTSINHKDRHTVPVSVTINDSDNKDITIQYQLNDDTSWTDLIVNQKNGICNATIDYSSNYTTDMQTIRFRAVSNIAGIGTKYSNVSTDYTFTLTSNVSEVAITSTYDGLGYDTFSGNATYTPSITLSGTVNDLDLDDSVIVKYYLDGTYVNQTTLNAESNKSLNDTYNFAVDIRGCASGSHTLRVDVSDKYGNVSTTSKTFVTFKSPEFVNATVTNINHKDTHDLPITVTVNDTDNKKITIQYKLNNGAWTDLLTDKLNGTHNTTINLKNNVTTAEQKIRFRALSTIEGLGTKISNESTDYAFTLTSNIPSLSITSTYDALGYDTFSKNATYTPSITLNGTVNDLDLDDSVIVKYYLDGLYIDETTLKAANNSSLNDSYSFTVDISNCASTTHTLRVDIVDRYGNTNTASKTFVTYKSPDFVSATVTSINHKDTHIVPISVVFGDSDNNGVVIQYQLNNDTSWTDLALTEINGIYSGSIDYSSNYTTDIQTIRFRAVSNMDGLGTKYSNVSPDYTFTLTNNVPEVDITSTYDALGYDTFSGNDTYTPSINLSGTVNDLDLDDSVIVKYYLDGTYVNQTTLNAESNKSLNDTYNFTVDISNCISGLHTLKVDVSDKYGNTNTISKTFYTFKSPEFVSAIVTNINHKDTHDLPITVTVNDSDDKNITIQYKLNNGAWTDLLIDKLNGTHNTTINLKDNVTITEQKIRFRALSTIEGLGTKISNESTDYTFTLTSNVPSLDITSTYDALGYDTFSKNATYTPEITLSGTVNDLDLDDSVIVKYYLDGTYINQTTLNTEFNKSLNSNYNFTVDIRGCASGSHTLRVDIVDRYGNTNTSSKTFVTYKSPDFVSAIVTNINHKDTHDLPITVTVNDTDNKNITIQYQLNNNGIWIDLLVDKLSGTHNTTINLKDNVTITEQKVKFRALSTIEGLGTKISNESTDYAFTLTSNISDVAITSTYNPEGYDTFSGNTTYTPSITLSGTVKDLDLDDIVVVKYYLDNSYINQTILSAQNNTLLNDVYNFIIDIRGCASGSHTLRVDVSDRYGNTNTTSKTFYTFKSPDFISAIVTSIDHKDRHTVPINLIFNDADNKNVTIQYQLNNDSTWTDLLIDKIGGTYDTVIDYTTNYTTAPQTIKFRAVSNIQGLGTKYSDISGIYNFTVTSNDPVLEISSTYKPEGYNTAVASTNYVSEINLNGTLKDIDLGDIVKVKYTLDGTFIEEKTLSNGINSIDTTYGFVVDISKLEANDNHTLVVTATDLYGRTASKTTTFKTYINNTATFKSLVVESINHKTTHKVPIKFELFDEEVNGILVEYKLRSEGETFGDSWTTLVSNGENKFYTEYLDYETNYTQKNQYIKFRLYDGTTYSTETSEYLFTLTSNPSVITIKSDYSKDYYNTAENSTNYVGSIPFNLNLTDLDLGDTVTLKYKLDGVELNSVVSNNSTNSINKDYNFTIDISECVAGEHTLIATAVDNYGNTVSSTTKFKTYINYSPVINNVLISDINHKNTHLVPIDITVSDKDKEPMLIEYSLNGGAWTTLLSNKLDGTHHRDLDYTNDYTLGTQTIQFRLYDGTTYSNLSQIYNFTITSNNSVININSNYNENGYNTSTLSTNLTTSIPLNISVTDTDLGDLVKTSYYLDNKLIESIDLTNGVGIAVNKTHQFTVDISALNPGTHTLKVVGIDRYLNETVQTKDFLTYSNDRIKIKNFNVNIEQRFNGAIYINQDNKEDASINFTLEDNDDNNVEYFIDVDYDFNGTTFTKTQRFASTTVTKSTTDKVISLNLHQLLGNTDISGTVRFRISANDTRLNVAQRQAYEVSIISDTYSKVITLTKNTNPEIINFNLPSNSYTLKNIYDVLMTGQTVSPAFNWLADAGTSGIYKNYEYGDEITSYQILYSIDNWATSKVIATNIAPTKTSLSWLNNTGYDNSKVQFKLIATDYFGATSEKILDDSYNYYLQINSAPKAPLSLTIRNLNQSNISYGELYTFDWGISSEPDAGDSVVAYVFGYKLDSTINNYDEITEIYRGTNKSYINWKNTSKDSITFAVYSIDKFGTYSEIQTFTTSSMQNNKPNAVTSYQLKDVSFASVDKGYIKKNETYLLSWADAGDPDSELGDSIQSWKVLYNVNGGEWTELYTTKNSLNILIKNDGSNLKDVVNFKILAYDKFNEYSESAVFTYDYITDLTGPTWVNSNKYKGESSNSGQKVYFDIVDNGGVSKVEVYNGSVLLGTLYNDLLQSNPLVTSVTSTGVYIDNFIISKNGIYTLRLTDKYKNVSNYSFTINEIDTVAPAVGILADKDNTILTNTDVTLTINATDDTVLSKVEITDSIKGTQTFTVTDKTYSTTYVVSENSTISVKVTDKSGNISTGKYIVTNINKTVPVITNNYNNSSYADLETSFKVTADLGKESSTSLGTWSIVSTGDYTYQTLNTSETEINITVQKNQTIKVKFTDVWGNQSAEMTINIDNIIDGVVSSDLMYLTTMADFLKNNPGSSEIEVKESRIVYTLTSSKYTNNIPVDFVKLSSAESILYPAYAYIVISDSDKQIAMVENKTNNQYIDILNSSEALFKFTEENKMVTFYLKDIFNHYTINRLNVSKIASDIKTTITYKQDIETITNKSVNVLFDVEAGYFEDNSSLYQYIENGVVKSYYNNFIWVEELKDTDIYNGTIYTFDGVQYKEITMPTNVSDRRTFVYTFNKNTTFKVWAIDNNDGWLSKIAYITNIDKTAPSIIIDSYNSDVPNTITITAHTNDSFYTAAELASDSFYNDFDLTKYIVSADKKTATMTFTTPNNVFRFKAYDKANNQNYSAAINVNIYIPDTTYSIQLVDSSTGVEKEVSIDDLNNLRTNKNITLYINITSENGTFVEDLNNNYEYINEKRLKVILTSDGVYNFYSKDSYNNENIYTLEVKNVINKTEPDITINTVKNNDGKYIASVDILATSNRIVSYKLFTDTEVISDIVDKDLNHTFNVLSNGVYYIEAIDIYGNVSRKTIEITGIFMKQDQPKIYVSQYTLNPTNKDIEIVFTVENGRFVNWSEEDFVSKDETNTSIKYIITANKTINVSAVNYYDYEKIGTVELETLTSLISSSLTISNIDKIAPIKPSYVTYLNDNGLISFKFIDNGDTGFGTIGFKYVISNGTYNDSKDINKDKIVGINQYDSLYTDGNYDLDVYAFDRAGNISEVEEYTIYSNNKVVNDFMTTYNTAITDLLNNDLTEDEKTLYLLEADDMEANLNTLVNIEQKEFLASKINDFRSFLGQVEIEQQQLIETIDAYFDRLELNFRDNSFMQELLIKINLVKNESIKTDYINLYNYYKELIKNTFIDKTSTEFNYVDANGNTLNPLSGYILNSNGVYGYYNSEGTFVEGSNNQLYYYTSTGELIQLDYYKKTYVDGNKNIVKVDTGLVNTASYYDSDGNLLDFKKYINGFYDFQGIWHDRGSATAVLNPEYVEDEPENPTPTPGGNNPTPTPGGNNPTPTPGDNNPTPTPDPGTVTPTTPPTGTILASSITVSTTSLELLVGKSALITATVLPKETTDKTVSWSSNNTSVATVDSTGKVSAIAEGTAIITAKTTNNCTANLTVYVSKISSVVDTTEQINKVNPVIEYPTIDEIINDSNNTNTNDDKDNYKLPSYNTTKVGDINCATITNNNLTSENYLALQELGYSTVLYNGFTTLKTANASKAEVNIGMGNNNFKAIMSSKDIASDGNVTAFKLSYSGNKVTLEVTGAQSLGNNSTIQIYSSDKNKLVYYNDRAMKATYDDNLDAYVITNPLSGTYNIGDKQVSGYVVLDEYGLVNNNVTKKEDITYTNIIVMAYNALNEDDFKELYSNIDTTSSIYREVSILQKYGILEKTLNFKYTDKISGKDAFDIIYLTLSNLTSDTLNYDNSEFVDLKEISLSDINNMVKVITEK